MKLFCAPLKVKIMLYIHTLNLSLFLWLSFLVELYTFHPVENEEISVFSAVSLSSNSLKKKNNCCQLEVTEKHLTVYGHKTGEI